MGNVVQSFAHAADQPLIAFQYTVELAGEFGQVALSLAFGYTLPEVAGVKDFLRRPDYLPHRGSGAIRTGARVA